MDRNYILEALDYNPKTGDFFWKKRPIHHFKNAHGMNIWNSRHSGKKAGVISHSGVCDYVRVKINIGYKQLMAHRVAWIIEFGEIPHGMCIDHINGVPTDNRIENLRIVSLSVNHRNRFIQKNNTSGFPGVRKQKNRWTARIKINRVEIYIGTFKTFEEAVAARTEYARKNQFTEKHNTIRG